MKILLVDDHPLLLRGVAALIEQEYPGAQVEGAGTAAEGTRLATRWAWDLVVLDLRFGEGSGVEVLAQILSSRPRTRVLVYSAHSSPVLSAMVIREGAMGFISKGCSAREFMDAVRAVAEGRRVVPPEAMELLLAPKVGLGELSGRELDVVQRLVRGQTGKEIAEALALSPKTVTTYRARALEKLGVDSLPDLVRLVEAM